MRKSIAMMIVVSIIFSTLVTTAGAAPVKPEKLSHAEAASLTSAQSGSADVIGTIRCGGDSTDTALAAVGIFFLIILFVAAASAG